jgi:uroporphyrinogen-III synthase
MRLLVTRPEPDNARTAAALRVRGHEVMLAPLLHIEAVADADLGAPPWAAILLSSANGARAIAAHARRAELSGLPVLAVGRSSAEAARAAGFADVVSADGDGRDLARLAAARLSGSHQPLLYLAGEDRARDLVGELAAHGLTVRTVVIYRAASVSAFPQGVRAALEQGRIDGVLHFSRRSADTYVACAGEFLLLALAPVHYCLSAGVAEPLKRAGAKRIRVAAQPEEASLLALVTSQD